MNRSFGAGPRVTGAAGVGRAASAALELACKGAVAAVGLAIVLGMTQHRRAPSEGPGSPNRPRVAVSDDGRDVRVFPRAVDGQGTLRLVLHDLEGHEICTIEHVKSGPLILFGRAGGPVRMGLQATRDGGFSWTASSPRGTTWLDMAPDGATGVTISGGGPSGPLRRAFWLTPDGEVGRCAPTGD